MTTAEEMVRELERVRRLHQDLHDPVSREALSRYALDLEASILATQAAEASMERLFPN